MDGGIMKTDNFIKASKNIEEIELFSKRPTALLLLWVIAVRAKRTFTHPNKELQMGEGFIGDYKTYGVTEQVYRSDKMFLEKHGKSTFKSTNKGTIARIVSTTPFDINVEQITISLTDKQRTSNKQATTNNNEKNEKNEKNKIPRGNENSEELIKGKDSGTQSIYKSLIAYCAFKGGQKHFTNYGKQIKYAKLIVEAPHTEEEIRFTIDSMASEKFWNENTFDMKNVFDSIDRQLNKFHPLSKGGSHA